MSSIEFNQVSKPCFPVTVPQLTLVGSRELLRAVNTVPSNNRRIAPKFASLSTESYAVRVSPTTTKSFLTNTILHIGRASVSPNAGIVVQKASHPLRNVGKYGAKKNGIFTGTMYLKWF